MQESKIVSIDGVDYTLRQLPPTKALKLLAKLVRLLGVPLASMMGTKGEGISDALPKAMSELVLRVDEDSIVVLFKELMSGVMAPGQGSTTLDMTFESYFMGKLGAMMELSVEVVRFNFDDFLVVLKSAGSAQLAAAPRA